MMSPKKAKILYFYDALCGWCYGFSPVIERIYQHCQDRFEFSIISGGLKIGDQAGPIGVVAPYIKAGAYKTVERTCGVKFGPSFIEGPLQEGTMILNSLPPAIALSIVKEKIPDKAFTFASILHRAIYVDGLHPENIEGYGSYSELLGLDSAQFITDMNDQHYIALAHQEIAYTKQLGISGFPTLIAVKDDSATLITQGFSNYRSIADTLSSL